MGFSGQEYKSGVAISFSRGSSQRRDQTQNSYIADTVFSISATREAPGEEEGWKKVLLKEARGQGGPEQVASLFGATVWEVPQAPSKFHV